MYKKILMAIFLSLTFLTLSPIFTKNDNIYAKAELEFESHTIINKFSVLIPPNWNAKTQSNTDDFFILTNYELENEKTISTHSIKTEVIFIAEPLDVILENHFRAIKRSPEAIVRRGDTVIDGQSAKRVWYQGDGMNFPNTISSYISYDDYQTVVIHSYYHPENPIAVDTIEKIHWSFENLE